MLFCDNSQTIYARWSQGLPVLAPRTLCSLHFPCMLPCPCWPQGRIPGQGHKGNYLSSWRKMVQSRITFVLWKMLIRHFSLLTRTRLELGRWILKIRQFAYYVLLSREAISKVLIRYSLRQNSRQKSWAHSRTYWMLSTWPRAGISGPMQVPKSLPSLSMTGWR